ncbi:MAG: helix-turn-helix domain-containing protein, partial [Thermodesulfobacteriota bacterium]|nr:helix-turn-helix domain-containing protein [Thermodesulfobacteriota bacterium]MDY6954920.1 helix-turn-helix domain-containing protein [Thermodesulfobacteriota bacterium]
QTAEESDTVLGRTLEDALANLEREMIIDALKTTRGNMAKAAQIVKTTERKFAYKAKKHGVDYRLYR